MAMTQAQNQPALRNLQLHDLACSSSLSPNLFARGAPAVTPAAVMLEHADEHRHWTRGDSNTPITIQRYHAWGRDWQPRPAGLRASWPPPFLAGRAPSFAMAGFSTSQASRTYGMLASSCSFPIKRMRQLEKARWQSEASEQHL